MGKKEFVFESLFQSQANTRFLHVGDAEGCLDGSVTLPDLASQVFTGLLYQPQRVNRAGPRLQSLGRELSNFCCFLLL